MRRKTEKKKKEAPLMGSFGTLDLVSSFGILQGDDRSRKEPAETYPTLDSEDKKRC